MDNSFNNIIGNPKFVNTRHFREAAIAYKKNGGRYTKAPVGSKDWYEFWQEQERRCLYGYKVGGVKVTGRHYFYMNFTQLKKVDDELKGQKVAYKEPDFPSFFEIDYDWFWYKEIAWYGCDKNILDKLHLWRNPRVNEDGTYGGGMHLGCLKTRRAGFSYKEGADGVYNYNFIPASKSYYFAAIEDYLTVDGILNKVQFDLEFLNQHTDEYWLKNRMEKNTLMHQKASYVDEFGNKKGTNSEIIGVIVNDPDKVRGKDGMKLVYEEAGSFKDLKRALAISVPSVSEGSTLTGQISIFGTGGEEKGQDIEGLQDIFETPRIYKCLPFENDWEEGYEGTECGVFVPCYMANRSFMDLDGNINIDEALKFEDKERELKRKSTDSREYDLRVSENPKTPSEALLRVGDVTFPKAEALVQKNRVLQSREIKGLIQHGKLLNHGPEKGLQFEITEGAKPLLRYPHKNNEDIRGCLTVVEKPQVIDYRNKEGKLVKGVPPEVYIIFIDPYYKDEPKGDQDTISLGAIYVCKQRSLYFDNKSDIDVAWFVGRPGKTEELYDIAINLAMWYNGKIQGEIAGGGQGLVDRARVRKKLSLLCFEPIYINNKEIEKISKNRSFLMDISTDEKRLGIQYYADWLKTVVGIDQNGGEIWNLHYIYDLGLLDEILKFNSKGNFDRISAQIVKMFQLKEVLQEKIKKGEKKKKDFLGSRPLFGGANTNQDELILLDDSF